VARVLIVEDEPTDLAIVKGLVELLGHEVYLASEGEEAYKKYLRHEIEVVITDLEMPGVGGLEFIESLLGLYSEAKIIAVSAGGPDRLHAARRAGATVLLSKPIGPEELGKALAEVGFGEDDSSVSEGGGRRPDRLGKYSRRLLSASRRPVRILRR
jgi:CheY-like chemotaxis protein